MFRFLQKFRQNNMKGSKPASSADRYFKYAIGEIILVVIGILIALHINNWNEKRKIQNQAEELTDNLLSEMDHTVKYLNVTSEGIDHQIAYIQMILDANSVNVDFIISGSRFGVSPVLYMSSYSQFFDPPSNIYQTAINDGSIRNIKDKKLLGLLQGFHQSVKVRIDQLIEEEYALGREINNYISQEYPEEFEGDFYATNNTYDTLFLKDLFLKMKMDGTLRYKLAERIEYKKVRQRFILSFKEKFENQLSTYK